MKLHAAQLVLAAVLAASSASSIPGVPAECQTSGNCSICITFAQGDLILSANKSPKCQYVEEGIWDESIQTCIDDACSSTEEGGCIEGLQELIDATSVDFDAIAGETVGEGGIICNKAGGNVVNSPEDTDEEEVDDDEDDSVEENLEDDVVEDEDDGSTSKASSVPAECKADPVSLCPICINNAHFALILSARASPKCKYVEEGKWDDSIQECIDGVCASTVEGCIKELQTWIDATSVDINAITGQTDIICNKAGGNEAIDDDGVRCEVIDPPESTFDGMKTMEIQDGVSGKVFDSNCVDRETQSLITAVCLSEEDCSEYGVPFKKQADEVVNNSPKYSDDEEDDEEDDGFFDPSSANARVNGIGGMLTMAAVAVVYAYVWNM